MSSESKVSVSSNAGSPLSVLVLGGCGFIGRNLVSYLAKTGLVSKITVADKSMPATSGLNPEHKAIFDNKSIVEFKQADLTKDPHVSRVFKDSSYTYVFNLCGETRFGLSEEDYKNKCLISAEKCVQAAASTGTVKKFIEVSTAQVYNSDKDPSTEDGKLKPWTVQAKYRLAAEEAVTKLAAESKLPVVILRPSIVYGCGDLTGLTPRISCAAVYQQVLHEKMKFLWTESLRHNVVHVDDVVRAMWIVAQESKNGEIFNLSDPTQLTQGELNETLGKIFGIETGFHGSIVSNMAKVSLGSVADQANDKHVPGWTKLCADHNILNTPISPYIDKELLKDHHCSVDGTKITTQTSFRYQKPFSEALVREQIQQFIDQGFFPKII